MVILPFVFCSLWEKRWVSKHAKSVANRLGHKNCDVTLKIYTAVTEEMKEKAEILLVC